MSADGLYPLYTTQFSTALELKLQQMGTLLRPRVSEGFHTGKMASPVNQVGAISMKAPAGRYAPKQRTDAEFTRRWVFPQDKEVDQLIDSFDELKTIVDPKSKYVENAANAAGRAWDDAIIDAAFAVSYTGQDANGLTQETFDATTFGVSDTFGASGTSVGLTPAKLIEARRKFRHYHVQLETDPLTLIIGSQQESDLLQSALVTSLDYNERPVLTDGKVTHWLGFDFVYSERLPVSNSIRQCIAFARSGMYLGVWKETMNRVSIRNELSSEPYDLYTACSFGATRTQPGKVLQILCGNDTTGGDITA